MGLIQDVGGKLVQSFLSLDDLVLGQGLISEGRSQLELTGRSVAGSIAVGSNVAVRAVHAGIQAGAKTARATASALDGFVPGARLARSLAARVDQQTAAASEEASRIANYAVELTNGKVPRNPLTNEEWLSKSVPFGYGWSELAADTALGSFGRLAALPLTLGRDTAMMMSSTGAGRELITTSLKSLGMLLNLVPGASSTKIDTSELREALMTVTASAGDAASRNLLALIEATARLAFGDTRQLLAGIEEALDQMRLLAAHEQLAEMIPGLQVSGTLRKRARRITDNVPSRFLKALAVSPEGEARSLGSVLSAALADAEPLRIFTTEYPIVLGLMGGNISLFLTAGIIDVGKIASYVQTDSSSDDARPWSAAQLEAHIGNAPQGAFMEPAIQVARDTVFAYSSEVLGRKKALARAQRLYSKEVQDRLDDDVSLDSDVRNLSGVKQDAKLRQLITNTEDNAELSRRRDACQQQLAGLDAFTDSLCGYQPKEIAARQAVLRTFLSLVDQNLALRGALDPTRQQVAAKHDFEAWMDSQLG